MENQELSFELLRKLSFSIAYNITQNTEDAEDIAQTALFKFISSKDILDAKAWIAKVTQNLSREKYRRLKTNKKLFSKLRNHFYIFHKECKENIDNIQISLPIFKIKKYLSKSDLEIYFNFINCNNSIKTYSEKFKKKYSIANKEISVMKRNLKAGYLFEKGFKNSDVLTYNQWHSIYRMINRRFLKKSTDGFQIDKYFEFGFLRKSQVHHLVIIGEKNEALSVIVLNICFYKNKLRIKEIKMPSMIKKISFQESLIFKKENVSNKYIDLEDLKNNIIKLK